METNNSRPHVIQFAVKLGLVNDREVARFDTYEEAEKCIHEQLDQTLPEMVGVAEYSIKKVYCHS